MKRFLTMIAVISVTLVAMAQHPLVTLSHNNELSFFTSLSALQEALDSAVNGDIIYLTEGKYSTNSSEITIDKSLSIIGCGYKSHILADIDVDLSSKPDIEATAPLFDGVRLQKLRFYNYANGSHYLKNVEIRKTWIRELENGGYAGKDFTIDRCYVEKAGFGGATTNNTYIKNSKIGTIDSSEGYAINVINCNIQEAYYCPRSVISSIITKGTGYDNGRLAYSGSHTVINSWLPNEEIFYDPSKFYVYDCYFESPDGGMLDENLEATVNLEEKGFLGEDGTVIGIYGGEFPFSETPSVPTVDSAKSTVTFDAENNKLKVNIIVSPN